MAGMNEQVTDSVTQVNTQSLGATPAMGTGNVMLAAGNALSGSALDAANSQQQSSIVMQSATVQGVNSLFAIGSAVVGRGVEELMESEPAAPKA